MNRKHNGSPDEAAGQGLTMTPQAGSRVVADQPHSPPQEQRVVTNERDDEELLPAPFFYYRDFSTEPDPDPFISPTAPGRVPNFPAKMHSILSRPELEDIVAWLPHGRAWRILKPREFEIKVIPTYFEHSKFSSFIRQANGWGFRRFTQGLDRNAYYHPRFLRGLPHLCKKMKRPAVAEKLASDPDHEPDLYKIATLFPVPTEAPDDSILLHCTLEGGPKARMPVCTGSTRRRRVVTAPPAAAESSSSPAAVTLDSKPAALGADHSLSSSSRGLPQRAVSPRDEETLSTIRNALAATSALPAANAPAATDVSQLLALQQLQQRMLLQQQQQIQPDLLAQARSLLSTNNNAHLPLGLQQLGAAPDNQARLAGLLSPPSAANQGISGANNLLSNLAARSSGPNFAAGVVAAAQALNQQRALRLLAAAQQQQQPGPSTALQALASLRAAQQPVNQQSLGLANLQGLRTGPSTNATTLLGLVGNPLIGGTARIPSSVAQAPAALNDLCLYK